MSSFEYTTLLLDIEGTICPISFVKDRLFPYFLSQLPDTLSKYQFPLTLNESNDPLLPILLQFPESVIKSQLALKNYITLLVEQDIKDPTLKQLQGFIWEHGYTTGLISAPLYEDVIIALQKWKNQNKKVYIYSSGSIKAQKLLMNNVESHGDLTHLISGWFDTTIGKKIEPESYFNILKDIDMIDKANDVLFLSDNPLEIIAGNSAGLNSIIVKREGNALLTGENEKLKSIDNFDVLF